mmetsp:Transcript_39488/g.112614  ORF Transcript_39488/g.112614 Transcript_39488/m.112614 type:complete len:258 (-) Transcript_39488:564-1337(-)
MDGRQQNTQACSLTHSLTHTSYLNRQVGWAGLSPPPLSARASLLHTTRRKTQGSLTTHPIPCTQRTYCHQHNEGLTSTHFLPLLPLLSSPLSIYLPCIFCTRHSGPTPSVYSSRTSSTSVRVPCPLRVSLFGASFLGASLVSVGALALSSFFFLSDSLAASSVLVSSSVTTGAAATASGFFSSSGSSSSSSISSISSISSSSSSTAMGMLRASGSGSAGVLLRVMRRMPSRNEAEMPSISTLSGSLQDRENLPYDRS